jgi:hypothetical protein
VDLTTLWLYLPCNCIWQRPDCNKGPFQFTVYQFTCHIILALKIHSMCLESQNYVNKIRKTNPKIVRLFAVIILTQILGLHFCQTRALYLYNYQCNYCTTQIIMLHCSHLCIHRISNLQDACLIKTWWLMQFSSESNSFARFLPELRIHWGNSREINDAALIPFNN